jgi:heme/copper-type cytochrome/quinol oxidase subunit 2
MICVIKMPAVKPCAPRRALVIVVATLLALLRSAGADPPTLVKLTIKDHHFVPNQVTVPAGQRFRIELSNQDDTTDEFESYDMKFEKIVVPGGTIAVFAGPLHPGTYKFFDDYHPDQATGTVVATAEN